MQFQEPSSKAGKCPVDGNPVVVRSTRGPIPYCSQRCAAQKRYMTRYRGTNAGPLDRPRPVTKTREL